MIKFLEQLYQKLIKVGHKSASPNSEDKLVLECAKQINIKHLLTLKKVKLKLNRLIGLAALNNNSLLNSSQIKTYEKILAVLRAEQLSGQNNPYNISNNIQRLSFLNKNILLNIKKIRNQKLDKKTKQKLIDIELAKLDAKLYQDFNDIAKEIIDIQNRKNVYIQIEEAKVNCKKLKLSKISNDKNEQYYINLTSSIGESIAGITRSVLILTRHIGHISEAMPIIGAVFVLIGVLATILTLRPKDLEGHKLFNTLATVIAALVYLSSHIYTSVKDFAPGVASKVSWVPFLGTAVTWMLLGVEIVNLVYLEIRHYKELKSIHSICANSDCLADMSWLFNDNKDKLDHDQKKFKRMFDRHIAIEKLSDHDKDLILHLFKTGEFEDNLKPILIEHIKKERVKRLYRHAINVAILAVFATTGLISLFIPPAAPIIAMVLIGFVMISTIVKMTLFNTVLKEKCLKIEKFIPADHKSACELSGKPELKPVDNISLKPKLSKKPINIVSKMCLFLAGRKVSNVDRQDTRPIYPSCPIKI